MAANRQGGSHHQHRRLTPSMAPAHESRLNLATDMRKRSSKPAKKTDHGDEDMTGEDWLNTTTTALAT
jgi:hypothetical protein